MQLKRIQGYTFGLLLVVSLSACGGEGDTSTPPPATAAATSAEGLWTGTTNTNTNRTVTGVVLDDGVYWFLYSVAGDPSLIAGVVQGDSSSQNGTLISSNATDFSVERGIPSTLTASVDGSYTKQSLNGTISYQNNAPAQETFTTTYGSDYDLTPSLNAVAGKYIGFVTASETVTFELTATGNIIDGLSSTGCTFTGSFSPRARGNVFDVTITFNACSNGSDTVKGVGFVHAGKLYSAALNTDKTNGVVFIGTKQP